jgi:rhodanese-related sulfurtransferase
VSILEIDVDDLHDRQAAGPVVVVDVREAHEYEEGHVPGALLIPLGELPDRLGELPDEDPLVLICAVGSRSHRAAEFLSAQGRETINVVGGTVAWIDAGFPVDR